jgi:translation elongation factor P/translation initiation factor 5A
MKKASLTALAIVAILAVVAWAADVSGVWEMSSPGRGGEMMTRDITIVQEGNKITVTMPGRQGGEPIKGEGTLEGNAIEWKIVRQGRDGQEMTMTYKGTVDGATMKGTFQMMDREVEWTAKKK